MTSRHRPNMVTLAFLRQRRHEAVTSRTPVDTFDPVLLALTGSCTHAPCIFFFFISSTQLFLAFCQAFEYIWFCIQNFLLSIVASFLIILIRLHFYIPSKLFCFFGAQIYYYYYYYYYYCYCYYCN